MQKDRTILSVLQSYGQALSANTVALEKGASAAQATAHEIRETRSELNDLRVLVSGMR